MIKHYFLSVLGPDRAGLLDDLSGAVHDSGGSWMGSRLAHLGGMFAGISRIALNENALETLRSNIASIEFKNGEIRIDEDFNEPRARPEDRRYQVDIVANDQPGILHQVTSSIANAGLNIENADSSIEETAMGSGTLFKCQLIVSCTDESKADNAHDALEALTGEILIDWKVFHRD